MPSARRRRDVLADAVAPLPPVAVLDDFGPIGSGASRARSVSTGTGEFLVKGPDLTTDNQYVAANEYLAAKLARRMNLPILPCEIVELHGHVYFGSEYMPSGTWYPIITEPLFQGVRNREAVYGLVVFDAWIVNTDRHAQNLLVRSIRGGGNDTLLLNDHSHCLVTPPSPPKSSADLAVLVRSPVSGHVSGLDFIRAAVTEVDSLRAALTVAEAVTDDQLRAMVESAHPSWWPHGSKDKSAYRQFLGQRRGQLRSLFESERGIFPNLTGGSLR